MKKTNTKELALAPSEDALALLKQNFPQTGGFTRVLLPRITFKSQDVFEGKGKDKKVVIEAGTFFLERETEEVDEHGKKVWEKTEVGDSIEGNIIYVRKQLRMYDEQTEEYTSSPIFDTSEDVVPLFCNKKEVARGTSKELKAKYMFEGKDGKKRSALEDNSILYVIMDGEMFQLNLRGSSMYSFLSYARTTLPPAVLTKFTSEANENGGIEWNKMIFTAVRAINGEEAKMILEKQAEIKDAVAQEKAFFADADATAEAVVAEDDDF